VVITGCDTGLGRIAAKRFYRQGFKVFANTLLQDSFDSLKKELDPATATPTSQLIPLIFDGTDMKGIGAAVEMVQKACPEGLWALINNSEILEGYWTEFSEIAEYKRCMSVNFFGLVNVTRSFLPLIRQAKGRIVNVASVAGRFSAPGLTAYSASQYAIESFSDGLRVELKPFGVSVSVIEKGMRNTPLRVSANVALEKANERNPDLLKEYQSKWGSNFGKERNKVRERPGDPRVPDALIHATTAKYPKTRYPVGRDAKYFFIPLSVTPSPIVDWLVVRRLRSL